MRGNSVGAPENKYVFLLMSSSSSLSMMFPGSSTHEKSVQVDGSRFDALARQLGRGASRRPLLGAGLAALTAAGLNIAQTIDSEGKGKGKKKKKKKCKGNTKKCGQKCIPADQCCTSADCGNGGQCASGTCSCPAGQKSCNGGCIPQAACCTTSDCGSIQTCVNGTCACPPETKACGPECLPPTVCCSQACPGSQTCDNGTCVCDTINENPCPDGSCVSGDECCVDSQCPSGQECLNGTCLCKGDGITCDDQCCNGANAVCVFDSPTFTCESGGCGAANWCVDPGISYCSTSPDGNCVCQPDVDGDSACLDEAYLQNPPTCESCDATADCDPGFVCVAPGEWCEGCLNAYCVPTCDAVTVMRTPGRSNAATASRGDKGSKRKERK